MVHPFHTTVLRRIARGLLLVLLLGPTASVASTCASEPPPVAVGEHGGHPADPGHADTGHDACCDGEAAVPDCSGATPCASPCGVLPAALVLGDALPADALARPARQPGSLALPPPSPPPIR